MDNISALDRINVRRLTSRIQADLANTLADRCAGMFREPVTAEGLVNVKSTIDAELGSYLDRRLLAGTPTVGVSGVRSFSVAWNNCKKRPEVTYHLTNGGTHLVKKRFYGLRTAKVFGRHTYQHTIFADVAIKPIQPVEHITLRAVVGPTKECSD